MKRLLFTLLLFIIIPIHAQEIIRIDSYSNFEHTDLGNRQGQFSVTMARSFYVEKEYDRNGNIIAIRNISGKDTVSYVPSEFSEYYGEIIDGSYVDNFIVNDTSFSITLEKDFDIIPDTVINGKNIKKHMN